MLALRAYIYVSSDMTSFVRFHSAVITRSFRKWLPSCEQCEEDKRQIGRNRSIQKELQAQVPDVLDSIDLTLQTASEIPDAWSQDVWEQHISCYLDLPGLFHLACTSQQWVW